MRSTSKTNKKPSVRRKTTKSSTKGKKRSSLKHRKVLGLRLHHFGGLALLAMGFGIAALLNGVEPLRFANAATCTISENLVNSCRPWLGATVGNYPGVGTSEYDLKGQVLDHENRIGRQLDIIHSYAGPDDPPLDSTDKYFVNRANTILYATWKPSNNWASAGGSSSTVNSYIDQMADSIKSVAPKKIMLSIFHEPENDVSGGASGCSSYVGSLGTPAEYRAMWRNVYNRMNAKGVTNVVWVLNYMGYSNYNCMLDDLWPGNDIVDWVMWDPYSEKATWDEMVSPFYNTLTSLSNSTNDYNSKTWGLAEWGAWKATTRDNAYRLYDGGRAALAANSYPKLKAYVVFDYGPVTRVAYDANSVYDPTEQQRYTAFAQDAHFTDAYYTPPAPAPAPEPTPAPTPTPTPAPTPTPEPTPAPSTIQSSGTSPTITSPSSGAPVTLTPSEINSLPSDKPIPLDGVLEVTPTSPESTVTVKVDGEQVSDNKVDSTKLTDGEHVVEITENGKTKRIIISVDNPWPLQTVNEVKAHPVAYGAGGGATLATAVGAFLMRAQLGFMLRRFGL